MKKLERRGTWLNKIPTTYRGHQHLSLLKTKNKNHWRILEDWKQEELGKLLPLFLWGMITKKMKHLFGKGIFCSRVIYEKEKKRSGCQDGCHKQYHVREMFGNPCLAVICIVGKWTRPMWMRNWIVLRAIWREIIKFWKAPNFHGFDNRPLNFWTHLSES